jgi:ADP-ribose pyrophosphatase YjhB (NUDIX family)
MKTDRDGDKSRLKWLEWAKRLQALAQNGITYCDDFYDRERYEAVREIAAEMMATRSPEDVDFVRNLFAHEVGAATPKVDVRAAVFRDDTILLVKERSDGFWTLPGGWADVNEPPSRAVEREVYEESGYRTRAVKLLAVLDRDLHGHPPYPFHVYKLFFQCELEGGAATTSYEIEDVAFFTEDALPKLSLTRVTPAEIARLFDHFRHPGWPTDFD